MQLFYLIYIALYSNLSELQGNKCKMQKMALDGKDMQKSIKTINKKQEMNRNAGYA